MKNTIGVIFLLFLLQNGLSAQEMVKEKPVPPVITLIHPEAPETGMFWKETEWKWNVSINKYDYLKGEWVKVKKNHYWKAGYWEEVNKGYRWIEGKWVKK